MKNAVFTDADLAQWQEKGLVKKIQTLHPHDIPSVESETIKKHWASHIKSGFREDLGHSCRSGWEANYARYCKFFGIEYFYEPCELWFPVKRGIVTYKPDFWLPKQDLWVEVKGYMRKGDETKLKRFAKHYPNERIIIIGKDFFSAMKRQGMNKVIPYWE